MSRRIWCYLVCVVLACLLSTACSTRLADFTVISTKNVNLDKVDIDSLPQTRGITGKAAKYMILGIPLGFPHLEDAIDDALDKGGGDVMTDAVMSAGGWSALLIGQQILTVKGTVVKTRGATR